MMAPASSLSAQLAPELRAVPARQRGVDGRAEIRCAGCGYGAVIAAGAFCGSRAGAFTVEVGAVMRGREGSRR